MNYGEQLHKIASSLSGEEQQEFLKQYQCVFLKYTGKVCIDEIQKQFFIAYKEESKNNDFPNISLERRAALVSMTRLEYFYRKEILNEIYC